MPRWDRITSVARRNRVRALGRAERGLLRAGGTEQTAGAANRDGSPCGIIVYSAAAAGQQLFPANYTMSQLFLTLDVMPGLSRPSNHRSRGFGGRGEPGHGGDL